MERATCCIDLPSRGTASGTPVTWLVTAWREAAVFGGPAAVVVLRERALTIAWANAALADLLSVDVNDIAGRALRDFTDPAGDVDPLVPSAIAPELAELLLPQPGNPEPDPPAESARLVSWARSAHELVRSGGGTGLGAVRGSDGTETPVRLEVRAVPVDDVPPGEVVADGGRHQAGDQVGVQVGVQSAEAGDRVGDRVGDGPSDQAGAEPGGEAGTVRIARWARGKGPGIPAPGQVSELPTEPEHRCWLVVLEPVREAAVEAERALSVVEHRFQALASCAPVGIFASEAGLRLGYVNDYLVRLVGGDSTTLLGNGWLQLIHPDDLPSVYAAVRTVLGGTPVDLAVRLTRAATSPRWLYLRMAPTTTPARAAGFIGTAEDVTDRRSWEEHLSYLAHHDPLTGLVNRRRLVDVLTEQLAGHRVLDREFAVLFLDLDGFKAINDSLGHAAGDRALIEVARRMQRVARDSDVIARVSGDEFVVVLRNITSHLDAEAAARRHLGALAEPVRIGTTEVRLSASVGVALPDGYDTPDTLLREADQLMYEAKAAGQGLYRLSPVSSREEGR